MDALRPHLLARRPADRSRRGRGPVTAAWDADDGGVRWHLELERGDLLPGRLVDGRVRITANDAVEARRLLVELRGEERWEYETTSTDSEGHTTTERHTGSQDLPAVPVQVLAPVRLARRRDGRGAVPAPGAVARTAHRHRDGVAGGLVRERPARHRGRHGHLDRRARPDPPAGRPPSRGRGARGRVRPLSVGRRRSASCGATIALDPVPLCAGAPFTRDRHPPAVGAHRRPRASAPSCGRQSRRP